MFARTQPSEHHNFQFQEPLSLKGNFYWRLLCVIFENINNINYISDNFSGNFCTLANENLSMPRYSLHQSISLGSDLLIGR